MTDVQHECADWGANIEKVNGTIILQSLRAGRDLYDGKPFTQCPWCGGSLTATPADESKIARGVTALMDILIPEKPAMGETRCPPPCNGLLLWFPEPTPHTECRRCGKETPDIPARSPSGDPQ
jgi:hypothetical protein